MSQEGFDPLLIADLSHALNGDTSGGVNVVNVHYARFIRPTLGEPLLKSSEPGLGIVFEKDGERYLVQLSLYDGTILREDPSDG